ncbi:DedA family protein [Dermatophilus congolensis]|uniref:Inner membrane protein YghB n=1 Tax=Dermatophilus congolensis TaxID=1863 RepID=A0A239VQZ7_9MICO|nr:DedA family protein [Dermatophilus congolensis]SNV24098.1 Inner membrane protein YghB [Dermatophilus congolensis]
MLLTGVSVLMGGAVAAGGAGGGMTQWIVGVMEALGAPGAGLLVALENVFPPIPSEVILPLAGFTASQGTLSLMSAIVWTSVGSLVGAWALYALGVVLGRDRLFRFFDWMPLVDVEDIEKAEAWFNRYGYSVVFFGRMLPLIRSLISIPAGLSRMPLLQFSVFSLVGSVLWNSVLIYAGFALGEKWDQVEQYVGYLQYVVIAAIVAFLGWYLVRYFRKHRAGGDA